MEELNARADLPIQTLTVGNVTGGLRGLSCMLWEISGPSPSGELAWHGKTLLELEGLLPKWPGTHQLSPEAFLWWLYTATMPSPDELKGFVANLILRAERIPEDVKNFCDALPHSMDPSTQLAMCLTAYSQHSRFLAALEKGTSKRNLWPHALEDALSSTAAVVILSARIYINKALEGKGRDAPLDRSGDLSHNFAHLIGRADLAFSDFFRLTYTLAMDHGATISEHVMRERFSLVLFKFLQSY